MLNYAVPELLSSNERSRRVRDMLHRLGLWWSQRHDIRHWTEILRWEPAMQLAGVRQFVAQLQPDASQREATVQELMRPLEALHRISAMSPSQVFRQPTARTGWLQTALGVSDERTLRWLFSASPTFVEQALAELEPPERRYLLRHMAASVLRIADEAQRASFAERMLYLIEGVIRQAPELESDLESLRRAVTKKEP
jgi:hypothetical protein